MQLNYIAKKLYKLRCSLYGKLYSSYRAKGLVIFCFHDITDKPSVFQAENNLYSSCNNFYRQIKWIKNNFRIISPSELDEESKKGEKPKALITFDDGFKGTFLNGIRILSEMKIHPIVFLNMKNIIYQNPLISAIALYLSKNTKKIEGISGLKNLHLYFNPDNYCKLNDFIELKREEINEYQGPLAELNNLLDCDKLGIASYGNHLYEHYNSLSLNKDQLIDSYNLNERELKKFSSYINIFAFTNGRYGTSWNEIMAETLRDCGAKRIMSADGFQNRNLNKYILDRISIGEFQNNEYLLNFLLHHKTYE